MGSPLLLLLLLLLLLITILLQLLLLTVLLEQSEQRTDMKVVQIFSNSQEEYKKAYFTKHYI